MAFLQKLAIAAGERLQNLNDCFSLILVIREKAKKQEYNEKRLTMIQEKRMIENRRII